MKDRDVIPPAHAHEWFGVVGGHPAGDSLVNGVLCGHCGCCLGCLVRGGERLGDRFQRFACGVDAQEHLHQAAGQHDAGPDQLADEQAGAAGKRQRADGTGSDRVVDRLFGRPRPVLSIRRNGTWRLMRKSP
jgi:hypothetical protein